MSPGQASAPPHIRERPRRTAPALAADPVAWLKSLVAPQKPLRFRRGTAPLADYESTVRAGIVKGEERHVPVEFWTETDAGTMDRPLLMLRQTLYQLKL